MAINLNIKHNNTDITNITSGSITLNTANKYCLDNLNFTLSGVEYWEGDLAAATLNIVGDAQSTDTITVTKGLETYYPIWITDHFTLGLNSLGTYTINASRAGYSTSTYSIEVVNFTEYEVPVHYYGCTGAMVLYENGVWADGITIDDMGLEAENWGGSTWYEPFVTPPTITNTNGHLEITIPATTNSYQNTVVLYILRNKKFLLDNINSFNITYTDRWCANSRLTSDLYTDAAGLVNRFTEYTLYSAQRISGTDTCNTTSYSGTGYIRWVSSQSYNQRGAQTPVYITKIWTT